MRRIYHRLLDEHGMADVSYQVVRTYVADRKPRIRAEAGRGPIKVFFPQTHRPGAEAEVDFGEVVINLRGEPVTCMLFSFRMSFSGKAIHRISASGGQEAFFEGHVHALKSLVGCRQARSVTTTCARRSPRCWASAGSASRPSAGPRSGRTTAWMFFYCQPGIEGAHEKGGVEGQIGWFRRNHLVPVPHVDSFEQLNAMVDEWDAQDDARRIGTRDRTIGEDFGIEQPLLVRLPDDDFETGTWLAPRVDRYSQVTVRTNRYSVPVRLVGRQVRVQLHASHLVVYDGREQVAWHERLMAKAGSRLDLDHYLEALVRKPGALPEPPLWNRPGRPGGSPRSTTPGGPRPARPTATRPAPAP